MKKGQGAYYSSGSRPNQSAHSWGYARLASAITGGKSAAVDFTPFYISNADFYSIKKNKKM